MFNPEDIKIATLRKGLGRLCEDKFKNLMMVKGYQVYTPVEDIWGSDFLISKNGKDFERIQVNITNWKDIFSSEPNKQIVDQIYQYYEMIISSSRKPGTKLECL